MVGSKFVVCWVSIIILVGSMSFLSFSIVATNTVNSNIIKSNEENSTNVSKENRIAEIDTTYGVITIELYEKRAPITTSNFINLSLTGFYDGLLFHRVIDDFVIQTGDPNTKDNNPYNDGSGGSSQTIPLEIDPELTHVDGAVGMARSSDPDSASSQFYICDGPQHGLDGDYAVFGVTIDGIDVVRKIAQVDTYGNKRPLLKDHPIEDVVMYSVFITENDSEFHYTPPSNNNDLWFDNSSNSVPGFNGILIIAGIAATVLFFKRNRIRK